MTAAQTDPSDGMVAEAEPDTTPEEEPWWRDEGMPWHQQPTRSDYWCMAWIGVVAILGLATIPLKGWLLGLRPDMMMGFTGSRIGAGATGALVRVGESPHWWAWLLLGSLVSIKLDWVYWWAGKLWGRGMIEVWAGSSERAKKRYDRVEAWAGKLGWLGILVAYVPIPLPLMPVVFVLSGASGMKVRNFMIINFIAATLWNLGFVAAGWAVGDPIVGVLHEYGKIVNYVTVALLIVVLIPGLLRVGKKSPR
jgi:membrane protein DedA with SNARE-associated domain